MQGNPIVYLDIKLGRYGEGTPLGRVMIELKARPRCAALATLRCASSAPRRAAGVRGGQAAWGSRGAARVRHIARPLTRQRALRGAG